MPKSQLFGQAWCLFRLFIQAQDRAAAATDQIYIGGVGGGVGFQAFEWTARGKGASPESAPALILISFVKKFMYSLLLRSTNTDA